jgi:HD superfamily phosphohydrolase YqeK
LGHIRSDKNSQLVFKTRGRHCLGGGLMARTLREVIAAQPAKRRAEIAAAYKQKLIAKKKKRQLEEAKRFMELDRNLIVIAVLIIALPIIAALAAILTALAVGYQ